MIKIVDPSGWNWDRPVAVMIKTSSRGLRGADRSDFIKVAGHQFLDLIDNIKIAKDEVPVHFLALGASEWMGPNRNGDGFKDATCRQNHKTFEKYARVYRNHLNKQSSPAYGVVKYSAYNPEMHRVELLTMLNASKEAAERNKGYVADKELAMLDSGKNLPCSMACKISADVCSGCGNRAKTRDEYCRGVDEGGHCKRGGCRNNLCSVGEDGHILHVDNPNPLWFDISHVYRPADRTAYGARADYLEKAASHAFTPGAELAELLGVTAPLNVVMDYDDVTLPASMREQIKLAQALALVEQQLTPSTAHRCCFDSHVVPPLTPDNFSVIGAPGTEKAAASLGTMADYRVILNLSDFANWLGKSAAYAGAAELLPYIYTELVERGDIDNRLASCRLRVSEKTAGLPQQILAGNLGDVYGLSPEACQHRATLSALRGVIPGTVKSAFWSPEAAAADPDAAALAESYALYKLSALHRAAGSDPNFDLTARLAVVQNKVI